MKILMINKYLYPKGGDAICALRTGALLRQKGHKVVFWGMDHPDNIETEARDCFVSYTDYNRTVGLTDRLRMAANLLYSFEAKRKVEKLIKHEKPDIVHLHNFAHQISPSILHIFEGHHIPVVATLHDYKLVCASYLLLCNKEICQRCQGQRYYFCGLNKCIKHSYIKSMLGTFEMYFHHRLLQIYHLIDVFVSPSLFLKQTIEDMGFRGNMVYLPNPVETLEWQPRFDWDIPSLVYFGRLSEEKGLRTLLEAVAGNYGLSVKLIGDGPLREELELLAGSRQLHNVRFLGYLSGAQFRKEIRDAMLVVLPSESPENNPLAVLEAFALGKPVLASRLGGIPELVKDGVTGMTFSARNVDDLRGKISQLSARPEILGFMGRNARALVESRFSPDKYYEGLMQVYRMALGCRPEDRQGLGGAG
jgi:glycosyltransferase involved in cell wall biosynthesis